MPLALFSFSWKALAWAPCGSASAPATARLSAASAKGRAVPGRERKDIGIAKLLLILRRGSGWQRERHGEFIRAFDVPARHSAQPFRGLQVRLQHLPAALLPFAPAHVPAVGADHALLCLRQPAQTRYLCVA